MMPVIILVRPQLGENIGAAARAMLNFGFEKLRIVNPRDGWPNQDAIATSVGAVSVIENAEIFNTTSDALADLELIYATTSRYREMNKPIISSHELNNEISASMINPAKIGIMFGAERSGLDNTELSSANKILSIPINEKLRALNLATSVGIICYELRNFTNAEHLLRTVADNNDLANHGQLENFFTHLEQMLDQNNFYQVAEKKPLMLQNIKNIFKRIDKLTTREVNTLIGIIRSFK